MLEVLIAIVVLSFGLLGMLGLIVNGLKMTSTSNYRSIAAAQFSAMAETLNANPEALAIYTTPASSAITANCLKAAGCDSQKLAATEYGLWQQRLASALPDGNGIVCRDSTPGDGPTAASPANWDCDGNGRAVVKICWNESRVSNTWSTACFSSEI